MLKCDFYGPFDRLNRRIHGFDDITLYFSKEFLRVREEHLIHLYSLLVLENQSILNGEEVFPQELATGHKKTSDAETFGRYQSNSNTL